MELVMCLSCGEFMTAYEKDGDPVPKDDECPGCGGHEFKHNDSDTVLTTDM